MTDAEKYVSVFRAAAKGVMEPYPPELLASSGTGVLNQVNAEYESTKSHARSMAGAFNAIADVFQTVVDAGGE